MGTCLWGERAASSTLILGPPVYISLSIFYVLIRQILLSTYYEQNCAKHWDTKSRVKTDITLPVMELTKENNDKSCEVSAWGCESLDKGNLSKSVRPMKDSLRMC